MTLTKTGYFAFAGGGKNGAIVDMWAASRFGSPPAENDPAPSGNQDAGPVVTGINFGGPGAYIITVPSVQDYYVRAQYGGNSYWTECPAGTIAGTGGYATQSDLTALTASVALKANIASPALTGTPTSQTPATSDNSQEIATTAFTRLAIGAYAKGGSSFNVQTFGGPDINGDWSAAFYAAAAAAHAAGGASIYAPGGYGTYTVGRTVPKNAGVLIPTGCFLEGDGKDATTIRAYTDNVAGSVAGLQGNVVQNSGYGLVTALGSDLSPQMDGLTVWGNPNWAPFWSYCTAPFAGTNSDTISVQIPPHLAAAPYNHTMTKAFGTSGYVWVADQIIQYTGITNGAGAAGTLTGCSAQAADLTWTAACTVNQIHARVYPFNGGGHGVAFQCKEAFVGRDTRVKNTGPGGHGIWLQGPPLGTGFNPAGSDIEPSRIDQHGGYAVAFGPQVTDARMGMFSSNLSTDGYGGVLVVGNGNFDLFHFHPATLIAIDSPSVTVCCSDVNLTVPCSDTNTCDVVRVDQTGHWCSPNQIRNLVVTGGKWESPGFPPPQASSTVAGYGSPVIQTANIGTLAVTNGTIVASGYQFGYSALYQEGPNALAALAGTATYTPATTGAGMVTAGYLDCTTNFAFDRFGDQTAAPSSGGKFNIVVGATTLYYTGTLRVGGQVVGAGPLAASGTATFTVGSLIGSDYSTHVGFPIGQFPASGVGILWATAGPVEVPFTAAAISGGQQVITYTGTAATAYKDKALFTLARFTGIHVVAAGGATLTDLTPITQPGIDTGKTVGFTLTSSAQSPTLNTGNLVNNVNSGSQFNYPPGDWSFVNYTAVGASTARIGEWSVVNNASATLKLPKDPVVGQTANRTENINASGFKIQTAQNSDSTYWPVYYGNTSYTGNVGVTITAFGPVTWTFDGATWRSG